MKFYNVDDVMEITGTSQNKAYDIIRNLQKKFYKRYPEAVFMQGKIVKWYFDEAMGIEKEQQINENN